MSIQKMSKEDLLRRLDQFVKHVPTKGSRGIDVERYAFHIDTFLEEIESSNFKPMPSILKKRGKNIVGWLNGIRDDEVNSMLSSLVQDLENFFSSVREWIMEISETELEGEHDKSFRFLGTVTTGKVLSQEGNPEKSQTMKKGKQKFLWQFLRTHYGTPPHPIAEIEKYIAVQFGMPSIKLTEKDFENLIAAISAYSTFPKKKVREAFILDKDERKAGLRKID